MILIVIAVILVVIAVIAIATMPYIVPLEPHFPPESPEQKAKRLSQENAYYAFKNAEELMNATYSSERTEATREVLENGWPTDPEKEQKLLGFLEQSTLSIAQIQEGLKAEYYMLPVLDKLEEMNKHQPSLMDMKQIAMLICCQAKWYEEQQEYEWAMNRYMDVLRMGNMIGSDGGLINRIVANSVLSIGNEAISRSIHRYGRTSPLRQALDTFEALEANKTPLSKIYEFECRAVDNHLVYYYRVDPRSVIRPESNFPNPFADYAPRQHILIARQNAVNFYVELLNAVDKTYHEFLETCPVVPNDVLNRLRFSSLLDHVRGFAWAQAEFDATKILIALQLFRVENGHYPEALGELIPMYLDELPLDPFSTQPFRYTKVDDDFRLYGCGFNGKDEGGLVASGRINGDQIIHLLREEWPALVAKEQK